MTSVKTFFRKYAVLTYFVLTFVLTWGGMALAAQPGGFPLSDEQLAASGPLVYMAMLIGPAGAAVLLTALLEGRAGFRELFSRLFGRKVKVRWYLLAVLTAPVLVTMILMCLSWISPEFQPALFASDSQVALILSSVAAGLAVGFFEELGWTGFAFPRIKKSYRVLATGLIVGIVWGAWHFPPFWTDQTFTAPLPLLLLLAQLFSWLPAYRILMVWVYDRTESLLISVLMHASLMGSLNALVPADLSGSTLLTWILSWAAVLWIIVIVGMIIQRKKATR